MNDYNTEVELRVWLRNEHHHIAERFQLREHTTTSQSMHVLRDLCLIACADGHIHGTERDVLRRNRGWSQRFAGKRTKPSPPRGRPKDPGRPPTVRVETLAAC